MLAFVFFFSMIIILIGMKFSSGFPFWLLTLSIFVGPCLSSSENSLFQSFIHLKIHMFIFLLLPYESFLHISDINFLPDTWFANIFSYFNGLVFLLPIDYFFILGNIFYTGSFSMQFYLSFFPQSSYNVLSEKQSPRPLQQFSPIYSSTVCYLISSSAWHKPGYT